MSKLNINEYINNLSALAMSMDARIKFHFEIDKENHFDINKN